MNGEDGGSRIESCAVLAIGRELLGPDRLDRNSLWLAERLEEHGLEISEKQVCSDDSAEIEGRIRDLCERFALVLTTGGLGPTEDDRTREAAAAALGRGLRRDQDLLEELEDRYRSRGLELPDIAAAEADLLEGGRPLPNRVGSAPGQLIEHETGLLVLLPGPPREMSGMFSEELLPLIEKRLAGEAICRRTIRMSVIGESRVETLIAPIYSRWPANRISILASPGDVALVATAVGRDGPEQLDELEGEVRSLLGPVVYGTDDDSLECVAVSRLAELDQTVAVAESCTGGLVAKRITDAPGASRVFLGGLVTYSNESKIRDAGVSAHDIETRGAVSEVVARALAGGVRARFGATWGLAATGIAGPDGGTAEKPVGEVHIAVASPGEVQHRRLSLSGDRSTVRSLAAIHLLDALRMELVREQ